MARRRRFKNGTAGRPSAASSALNEISESSHTSVVSAYGSYQPGERTESNMIAANPFGLGLQAREPHRLQTPMPTAHANRDGAAGSDFPSQSHRGDSNATSNRTTRLRWGHNEPTYLSLSPRLQPSKAEAPSKQANLKEQEDGCSMDQSRQAQL